MVNPKQMMPINLILAVKSAFHLIKIHPKETISIALLIYIIDSLITIPLYPHLTQINMMENPNSIITYISKVLSNQSNFIYLLVFMIFGLIVSLLIRIYYISLALNFFSAKPMKSVSGNLISCLSLLPLICFANLIYYMISFFGFLLLLVPGIIFMLVFYFYEYGLVTRQCSFFKSFSESQNLTRSYRFQLLGIIVFFNILFFSISSLISSIFGELFLTSFTLTALINHISNLFYVLLMSHIYLQLKTIKSSNTKSIIDTNEI
ncbi:MAG TPA: hypothetical protein PK581_05630 [Caldisericia bacterium]|nr:hypothetical protein [Caldisericia bacterium]